MHVVRDPSLHTPVLIVLLTMESGVPEHVVDE